MALISVTEFKSDWLNVSTSVTANDSMYARLIETAGKEIEDICNQPVEQQSVQVVYRGTGYKAICLHYTVPVTLTTVEYRDEPTDAWTAVTGCAVYEEQGVWYIYNPNYFTKSQYRFTLSVGYSTIPADLRTACAELAKELVYETPFAADKERFGLTAVSTGDGTLTISQGIAKIREHVKAKLQRYRRIII